MRRVQRTFAEQVMGPFNRVRRDIVRHVSRKCANESHRLWADYTCTV